MIEAEENKEYLPIEGLADFRKATLQLLLGSGHAAIKEVGPLCVRARMCRFFTDQPHVHIKPLQSWHHDHLLSSCQALWCWPTKQLLNSRVPFAAGQHLYVGKAARVL